MLWLHLPIMTPSCPTLFTGGTHWQASVVTLKWDMVGKSKPPPTGCNLRRVVAGQTNLVRSSHLQTSFGCFPWLGALAGNVRLWTSSATARLPSPTSCLHWASTTSERPQSRAGLCSSLAAS